MPYIEGTRPPLLDLPVECKKQLRGHTNVSDSDSFLSVSDMKIINNFTLICTLFIIHSQHTSTRLRSAKVLAVSLHLLSRLTRSAVAI